MEQINSRGQALEEGLDVFVSFPFLSDEYLTCNDSFIPTTFTTTLISTSTAEYVIEAVNAASLPIYANSDWFRYSSDGTRHPSVTSPVSADNSIQIISRRIGADISVSGIFQELKQLVKGREYTITVNLHWYYIALGVGTLGISRVYNGVQSDVTEYTLPAREIILDFTALSTTEILFLNFSSDLDGDSVFISSISVQAKDYYQLPVVADLTPSGFAKVLRRKYNQSIPRDEGEPA
tara:strand:+ start:191 stop:898 length:708 start_codon:yes stop_codon:yes gene_type:complete